MMASHLGSLAISLTKHTGIVGLIMTVSVVVSYFVDVFRYSLRINPFALIGSLFILAGISLTILMKGSH